MASRAVIPRFLLPLQGSLWRGVRIPPSQNVLVRFASSETTPPRDKDKPIVLEKPAKFNPPSHGSRLKRNNGLPKHYGPQLTADEIARQSTKHYPGVMAPEGSWGHWVWHSRLLHTFITMGTLLVLGLTTFFMNYAYNSPFKDLAPPLSDLWQHPVYFFAAWKNLIVMHERDKAVKASEHRARHSDDVMKRRYFMKMHGIEAKNPIDMVFGKSEEAESVEELETAALGKELSAKKDTGEAQGEPKPRKKVLGLF